MARFAINFLRDFSIFITKQLERLLQGGQEKGEPVERLALWLEFKNDFMRMSGFEPPRYRYHGLLRPARLPISPHPLIK